ncbi:MAG: response regulator transcription factor [Bacteroidetes bacterium]|nr:response regulator transcription factor [Bacteroidota bacterium]
MDKITTIIVDDELSGRQTLEKYLCSYSESFDVVGIAKSAAEGLKLIQEFKPALVVSDIEMPLKSGLEMIREALETHTFKIVLTTAYEKYAIKAINQFDVIGYLLKPIDLDEFYSVEKRILDKFSKPMETTLQTPIPIRNFPQKFFLPKVGGKEAVDPSEILYCKASGPYTEIHMISGVVKTISKPLKATEVLLTPSLGFFRVHDSYLVNSNHISELRNEGETSVVVLNKVTEIDVSRRKKSEFLEFLETRGLFFR